MTGYADPNAFSGLEIRVVNSKCDCLRMWLETYVSNRFDKSRCPLRFHNTKSGTSRLYLEIVQVDARPNMRQIHENRFREIKALHSLITKSNRVVYAQGLNQYNVIRNYPCFHAHLNSAYKSVQRYEAELVLFGTLFLCLTIGAFS
jgi:hypothetical protein